MKLDKIWKNTLAVVAGLWLLYIASAYLILNSDWLFHRVNQSPERLRIEWNQAWSWFPGHVAGSGVSIRYQSPRAQSLTRLAGVKTWIGIKDIRRRQITLNGLVVKDIDAQIRPLLYVHKLPRELRQYAPEIDGFQTPAEEPVPALGPFLPGWMLHIRDVEVSGSHRIWSGNFMISGSGNVSGSVDYQTRGKLSADIPFLKLSDFSVTLNDQPLISSTELAGKLEILPHIPFYFPGKDKLKFVTGDVIAGGQLEQISALDYYLESHREGAGLSGSGRYSGRLVTSEGRIIAPTSVVLHSDDLEFSTEKLRFASAGRILLRPESDQQFGSTYFRFELTDLLLASRANDQSIITIDQVDFLINAPAMSLTSPLSEVAVIAQLNRTELPDATVLNQLIPVATQTRFNQGRATIDGQITWLERTMSGQLNLVSEDLLWSIRDRDIAGDLDVKLVMGADLNSRNLSLNGSVIRVSNTGLYNVEDRSWSGLFELDRAWVQLDPDIETEVDLRSLVDIADGELDLHGTINDLGFVNQLLSADRKLMLAGPGDLSASLAMRSGVVQPGSQLQFGSDALNARFLDFSATGKGYINADIKKRQKGRHMELVAGLTDVSLQRDRLEGDFVQAPSISIKVRGRTEDLTKPMLDYVVDLTIPGARVPDISVYNHYLPEGGLIQLQGGVGTMDAVFNLTDLDAGGTISLRASDTTSLINGVKTRFDLTLDVVLSDGNPETRLFSLSNSRLELKNLNYEGMAEEDRDWNMRFGFEEGRLRWTAPLSLTGRISMNMASSAPLVEILLNSRGYLKLVRGVLSVRDVNGTANLNLDPDKMTFNNLVISGEDVQIKAKVQLKKDDIRGIVYNQLGSLGATVEFVNEVRDWTIFSARSRFEEYPEFAD